MDNETKDILMMLLEKVDNIGTDIKDLKNVKTEVRDVKLSIENNIKPILQAILENQTEVIN